MTDREGASDPAGEESTADLDDDVDWRDYDLDGELAGIEGALEEGLIFIESTGGWMVREDADREFGHEVAERMAAEQQVELAAYLRERREAYVRDQQQ